MPLLLILLGLLQASEVSAQGASATRDMARHAMAGAAVEPLGGDSAGVRVLTVTPGFTAASVGLQPGDVIASVDGRRIGGLIDYARAFRAWRSPGKIRLVVLRAGARRELRGPVVPRPREEGEGIDIRYESIVSDSGDRLRTIVTRPAGATGRLPAVLFVSWLSCSSIEAPEIAGIPGWRDLFHGLSRSGYLLLRVEKPGVGDSQGPDCSELGLQREIAGHRAGLRALRARADVDTTAIFVFGGSLGGALAPTVAAGQPVRGVMVYGTFARTWYEHILGHERRRLELSGVPLAEVNLRMRGLGELYAEYLIGRKTPAQVLAARPHLAELWEDQPAHQYGRPARFFHDLQRLNPISAWDSVTAPVLVLYGEHDWMMAREDHELIVRAVNANRPGSARLLVLEGVDHHLMRYPDRGSAFRGEDGVPAADVVGKVVEWLRSTSDEGPTRTGSMPVEQVPPVHFAQGRDEVSVPTPRAESAPPAAPWSAGCTPAR